MKKKIYLIIPTLGIGGAEKRYIDFWLYTQIALKRKDISLVITHSLYKNLIKLDEFKKLINFLDDILFLDIKSLSYSELSSKIVPFVRERNEEDIFHFPMFYPLKISNSKIIFSFTQSSLKNLNLKGRLIAYLSIFFAKEVDILDPTIYKKMSNLFFMKRHHIHMTTSSAINTAIYQPIEYSKKENSVVFLGRFVPVKQIVPLIQSIPKIHNLLINKNIKDVKFYILGYGEQESLIRKIVSGKDYSDINIILKYKKNPVEILKKSKIFLSLQKHTNYPSKSLLEAMACGNIPLVTDAGSTRRIARPNFSYFVNEKFTAEELAENVLKILNLNDKEQFEKSRKARKFVISTHSIEIMSNYYMDLYDRVTKVH